MRVDAHKNLQNWTLNSFFSFVFILYPCLVKEAGNSYLSPWASAFFRKHCKDTKFLGIYIALSPKKIKITFHAACETTFWARNGRNVSSYFQLKQGLKAGETSPNPSKGGGVWLHKEAELSAVFIISTSPPLEGLWEASSNINPAAMW
jgi:hypothetical protein